MGRRSGFGSRRRRIHVVQIPASDATQTTIRFSYFTKIFDISDFTAQNTNNQLSQQDIETLNEQLLEAIQGYLKKLAFLKTFSIISFALFAVLMIVAFVVRDQKAVMFGAFGLVAILAIFQISQIMSLKSKKEEALNGAQAVVKPINEKLKGSGVDILIPVYFPVYYQIRHNFANQMMANMQQQMMMAQSMNNSMVPMNGGMPMNSGVPMNNGVPQLQVHQ